MSKNNLELNSLYFIGLLLALGIVLLGFIAAFNLHILSALFLFGVLIFTFGLFFRPWPALLALLLARPFLDRFGNRTLFELTEFELNFNALLGLIVFFWGCYFFLRHFGELKNKDPRFLFIIPFLLVVLFSFFYSADLNLSLREFFRVGGVFLLSFAFFILVKSKKRLFQLSLVVVFSLLIPSLVAASQFISSGGKTVAGESFRRLYGTLYHPNTLAFLLVLGLGIISILFAYFQKRSYRIGLAILGLSYFLILLGTYTRGGWIAFAIFAFCFGLVYARKVLLFLGGFGLLVVITSPLLRERVFDLLRPDLWGSILWRLRLWKKTWPLFFEAPVFGHGFGVFKLLAERALDQPSWSFEAHNDYLRLAVELGAVGLGLYLLVWIKSGWELLKEYFSSKKELRPFYLGTALILFSFLVVSFGDNILRGTALQWALWAWVGGILGFNEDGG